MKENPALPGVHDERRDRVDERYCVCPGPLGGPCVAYYALVGKLGKKWLTRERGSAGRHDLAHSRRTGAEGRSAMLDIRA